MFLRERLGWAQWLGIAVFLLGALLYFGPTWLAEGQRVGLLIGLLGVLANAMQGLMGRAINRSHKLPPLLVTAVSMAIGSTILLGTGLAVHDLPPLSLRSWAMIGWLAVVNTAFAFWLWNHTQRSLDAVESSLINNTMLIQIAVLAWVYLGERPSGLQLAGILLAFSGVLIVQVWGALKGRGHLLGK